MERLGHQVRTTDAGVMLQEGFLRISSSRQQRAFFCSPLGSQQDQTDLSFRSCSSPPTPNRCNKGQMPAASWPSSPLLKACYLDTSLLVALLIREPRTPRVQAFFSADATKALLISPWTITEFASALALKERVRPISHQQRRDRSHHVGIPEKNNQPGSLI